MSEGTSGRASKVDIAGLKDRKLLEAQLLTADAQLRNFGRLRERLSASGQDPTALYRALQTRRDQLASAAGRHAVARSPRGKGTFSPRLRFGGGVGGVFGRPGTSGFVQVGPDEEGINLLPQGQYPTTGEIDTVPGSYPGNVTFEGVLSVGPQEFTQLDPTINYFWLHTWHYLVPFPPPEGLSLFTYSFEAGALFSIFNEAPDGIVMAFVSLGETANLQSGEPVVVNVDAGWPLVADLTQPGPWYNGSYGDIYGQGITVQRSFQVGAYEVPGVAIVVGAVVGLSMASQLRLTFDDWSGIGIGSPGHGTQIAYSYQPQLVIQQ